MISNDNFSNKNIKNKISDGNISKQNFNRLKEKNIPDTPMKNNIEAIMRKNKGLSRSLSKTDLSNNLLSNFQNIININSPRRNINDFSNTNEDYFNLNNITQTNMRSKVYLY